MMTDPGSRVGSRFGPYQLMQLLGRGGMGEVYQAEDTRKHRVVAFKLISRQFSDGPGVSRADATRGRHRGPADRATHRADP